MTTSSQSGTLVQFGKPFKPFTLLLLCCSFWLLLGRCSHFDLAFCVTFTLQCRQLLESSSVVALGRNLGLGFRNLLLQLCVFLLQLAVVFVGIRNSTFDLFSLCF